MTIVFLKKVIIWDIFLFFLKNENNFRTIKYFFKRKRDEVEGNGCESVASHSSFFCEFKFEFQVVFFQVSV